VCVCVREREGDNTIIFVVFCVVRAVHKFDFRLVINETRSKRRPVEGRYAVIETHVCDSMSFPATVVASVQGPYTQCEGQLHSLE
jgi:hypothetical protein